MWTILVLAVCAVYPALSVDLYQDFGALHIHDKMGWLEEPLPLTPTEVIAKEKGEAFLKKFLPKLDTTIEKSVHTIDLFQIGANVKLNLYNVILKGFQHATINNLEFHTKQNRVDLNISLPYLSARGSIFANGMLYNNTFAIVSNLSTFSDIVDVAIIIQHRIEDSDNGPVYKIDESEIKIDINDFMAQFTIIEELEAFKMILTKFLNHPRDNIISSLKMAVQKIANDALRKIPAADIDSVLFPEDSASIPVSRTLLRSRTPNYRYGYFH